jgi:hypothetical protein
MMNGDKENISLSQLLTLLVNFYLAVLLSSEWAGKRKMMPLSGIRTKSLFTEHK